MGGSHVVARAERMLNNWPGAAVQVGTRTGCGLCGGSGVRRQYTQHGTAEWPCPRCSGPAA